MTRTEFRKLYFSPILREKQKDIFVEMNQSLLTWEVSKPPPYAQKCQSAPVMSRRSSKKPLLIMEASLKIRYFDFKERSYSISIYNSMVSCGIRD